MATERRSFALLATLLAALAMIGPFTIDTYLPSFPAIQSDLRVSALQMQQTLVGLSPRVRGDDALSRHAFRLVRAAPRDPGATSRSSCWRSLGCALAANFEQLLFFRGAAGSFGRRGNRRRPRDHPRQPRRPRGAAPDVARHDDFRPRAGDRAGRRRLAADGVRLALDFRISGRATRDCCWLRARRGCPRRCRPLSASHSGWLRSPATTGRSDAACRFFCCPRPSRSTSAASSSTCSPRRRSSTMSCVFHETEFAWLFVPAIFGMTAGAFFSGRLAGRISAQATINAGFAIIFSAVVFNLAYSASAPPSLPWSVLPIMIYSVRHGARDAEPYAHRARSFPAEPRPRFVAAGIRAQPALGIVAGIVSPLLSHSAITLASGMALIAAMGWCAWMLHALRELREPRRA